MTVTIYHNPGCGTSRNTLGLIRNAGIAPQVIDYLHNPPSQETLIALIQAAGLSVRAAVRQKEQLYRELGLDAPSITDRELIEAMVRHPILINRPFVVTNLGVRLCRPSERVLDILPQPQQGEFTKEDGERVIDARGERISHE
jgi:arsenate reductase